MDGLRPDVDELDRFKHRAAQPVKADAKKTKGKKPGKPETQKASISALGIFMGLLLLLLLSAFAWYSWQQQQEIDRLGARLGDASGFMDQSKLLIARLEGRLSETGEVLAETGTSAEKKLAFLDSEMRKLWGVSNDRNKKAIEDNQKALSSLEARYDKLQKSYTAETRALKQELASVSGELKTLLTSAKAFDSKVVALTNELSVIRSEQESTVSNLKKQLAQQKQQVEGFKEDARSYLERLAKVDLSVESINVSRRQLNERVVDLDKKLNEVLLKLSAPQP